MFGRAKVAGLYLFLPLVLALMLGEVLLDNDRVMRIVAAYRPLAHEVTLPTNVVRQMQAVDARLREPASNTAPRVAFIGSSSVVNGIDVDVIESIWRAEGMKTEVVNAGMTGLVAYELPLLKHLFGHESLSCAVYLYNRFSFGDRFLGTVIGARWNTVEMARIGGLARLAQPHHVSTGFTSERFHVVRYGLIYRTVFARAALGVARPVPYPYDFYPGSDVYLSYTGDPVQASDTDWLRRAYVVSAQAGDSLGYRGLDRFLDIAAERGIGVLVAPVPEPDLTRDNRYRRGLSFAQMDTRVAQITEGRVLSDESLTRAAIAPLEANARLFRDPTHLNREGRSLYSVRLAEHLLRLPECHS